MSTMQSIGLTIALSAIACSAIAASKQRGNATVALYNAQAASPAPAPNTVNGGNWTIPVVNGSVTVGATTDGGLNGWIINDDSDNERLWYKKNLTAQDHAALADGWEMEIVFRMTAAGPTADSTLAIWYCNAGFDRWTSTFDINSNGALKIIAQHEPDGGPISLLEKVVTGNGSGTASYHTLSIINTTGDDEARLKFDGNLVTFDTGEEAFLPLDLSGETIYVGAVFGAVNWNGDGAMIVRSVELRTLPPCPADIAENNSEVNIFDLLRLLSNWGSDGIGASLAPPLDTIDIFDLLEVLSAWGTCD